MSDQSQQRDSTPVQSGLADLLQTGELSILGRLAGSSNGTLLCEARLVDETATCVYKPVAGERPLWDFPDGTLGHREVATYRLAELVAALAPDGIACLVPVTRWREEGPYGPGACQVWVDVVGNEVVDIVDPHAIPSGWLSVLRAQGDDGSPLALVHANDKRLRRMALIDAVANNSDRKGGHILVDTDGEIFGVDHGLCFNVDDKVRTVLWGWAHEPLDDVERDLLERLKPVLLDDAELVVHLSAEERHRTARRIDVLLAEGRMPRPSGEWPSIPWPAF